jgi:hypothetical protein
MREESISTLSIEMYIDIWRRLTIGCLGETFAELFSWSLLLNKNSIEVSQTTESIDAIVTLLEFPLKIIKQEITRFMKVRLDPPFELGI